MPFELKVIAEPLDEQRCGDCPLLKGQECLVFRRVLARDYSVAAKIGILLPARRVPAASVPSAELGSGGAFRQVDPCTKIRSHRTSLSCPRSAGTSLRPCLIAGRCRHGSAGQPAIGRPSDANEGLGGASVRSLPIQE